MAAKRIAIIGAGPVGLEAALRGVAAGHRVAVYERGRIGEHVRQWGHVRLFSNFGLNRSELGARTLREAGVEPPDDDAYLTGAEYVARYLDPLAASTPLSGAIRERTEVLRIGRDRLLKPDMIGGPREMHPFRLLLSVDGVESTANADVVIDCSGTWSQANRLGNGGIPAPGERAAEAIVRYRLDDILGADRARYQNRRVLVVGAGHSAVTALDQLLRLDGTTVVWARRDDDEEPYTIRANDPLPERDRLSRLGNHIAAGGDGRVEVRVATVVERLDGARVTLDGSGATETIEVDAILALVGYRPDRRLYEELQVHECWATMGPMKLAATLIGSAGDDCLAQSSAGPDALRSPEPGFFILGAKGYGRNSNFLIKVGLEQIRDVFALIEADAAPTC